MEIAGEVLTLLFSVVGAYQIVYEVWTQCEIEELGEAVVSKADTTVAFILTIIIVFAVTLLRWIGRYSE